MMSYQPSITTPILFAYNSSDQTIATDTKLTLDSSLYAGSLSSNDLTQIQKSTSMADVKYTMSTSGLRSVTIVRADTTESVSKGFNVHGSGGASTGASPGGGSAPTVTSASPSSAYTISTHAGIEEIYILTPSADISVNLPSASSCGSGYKYQIKNMASANTLTIDPNSTETIDGSTTFVLNVQYQSITIITDGSNWFII